MRHFRRTGPTEISDLMHGIAEQHHAVVVNGEASLSSHTGSPPHQQGVLYSYDQPETTGQRLKLITFEVKCLFDSSARSCPYLKG